MAKAKAKKEEVAEEEKNLTAIEKLEALINKEFGENSMFCPHEKNPIYRVPRMSTGNLFMDMDLGGGLAEGKIHLITGHFSSGKSYLCLKTAAEFTRRGMRVAFIDAEFTFDQSWAEACGVVMPLLHLIRKQVQEEVIDIVELLVASGEFGLIIIDSLAALIPANIREDAADKHHMGKEAKLNNKMFKKLVAQQSEASLVDGKIVSTVIVINQWREKVGITFGSPAILPGGKGQYYYSSTWIDFWADTTILDSKDKVVGMYFGYNIKKNKTSPPRRTGKIAMYVEEYKGMRKGDWDVFAAIIDLATLTGVLTKSGTWYSSPVLSGSFQYGKLWKALYDSEELEIKVVEAINAVIPEIDFNYLPYSRKTTSIQGVDVKSTPGEEVTVDGEFAKVDEGKDGGADPEREELETGKKRGKKV